LRHAVAVIGAISRKRPVYGSRATCPLADRLYLAAPHPPRAMARGTPPVNGRGSARSSAQRILAKTGGDRRLSAVRGFLPCAAGKVASTRSVRADRGYLGRSLEPIKYSSTARAA
jgi:hypothetical protein